MSNILIRGRDYSLDDDMPRLRSELVRALKNNLCEVRFIKADGTKRVMQCTLLETFMPEDLSKKVRAASNGKADYISVWCTETNEWRAFSLERFLRLTVL